MKKPKQPKTEKKFTIQNAFFEMVVLGTGEEFVVVRIQNDSLIGDDLHDYAKKVEETLKAKKPHVEFVVVIHNEDQTVHVN